MILLPEMEFEEEFLLEHVEVEPQTIGDVFTDLWLQHAWVRLHCADRYLTYPIVSAIAATCTSSPDYFKWEIFRMSNSQLQDPLFRGIDVTASSAMPAVLNSTVKMVVISVISRLLVRSCSSAKRSHSFSSFVCIQFPRTQHAL